jgi:hypothetical protein
VCVCVCECVCVCVVCPIEHARHASRNGGAHAYDVCVCVRVCAQCCYAMSYHTSIDMSIDTGWFGHRCSPPTKCDNVRETHSLPVVAHDKQRARVRLPCATAKNAMLSQLLEQHVTHAPVITSSYHPSHRPQEQAVGLCLVRNTDVRHTHPQNPPHQPMRKAHKQADEQMELINTVCPTQSAALRALPCLNIDGGHRLCVSVCGHGWEKPVFDWSQTQLKAPSTQHIHPWPLTTNRSFTSTPSASTRSTSGSLSSPFCTAHHKSHCRDMGLQALLRRAQHPKSHPRVSHFNTPIGPVCLHLSARILLRASACLVSKGWPRQEVLRSSIIYSRVGVCTFTAGHRNRHTFATECVL